MLTNALPLRVRGPDATSLSPRRRGLTAHHTGSESTRSGPPFIRAARSVLPVHLPRTSPPYYQLFGIYPARAAGSAAAWQQRATRSRRGKCRFQSQPNTSKDHPMTCIAPIQPIPPPAYPPPPFRFHLTDSAALALLSEVTAFALIFGLPPAARFATPGAHDC